MAGIANVALKFKKNYLDHGVVNVVTEQKKAYFSVDHGVLNVVNK